jgi:phosphate-selective porin OprO/OprP
MRTRGYRPWLWSAAAAELILLAASAASAEPSAPVDSPVPPAPTAAAPASSEAKPAPGPAAETAASTATAAAATSGSTAVATEAQDRAALERRVHELEETVRQLKDIIRQLPTAAPAKPVDSAQVGKIVDDKLKQQKNLVGWDRGFWIQSADGNYKLRVGGLIQTDFRAFAGDGGRTGADSFFLRRVRPILEGTLYKYVDFRLVPDFGGGATVLQDAYMDLKFAPQAKLRAGKFKEPFSLERLQSAQDITFVERSIAQNLAPNRDVGAQVFGDLFKGTLSYQIGAFNGVNDSGSTDGDVANDKDVAARVFAEPFKNQAKSPLQGLGVGAAATFGRRTEGPGATTFRTAGRSAFWRYVTVAPGIPTGGEEQWRFSPQFYYYRNSLGVMGEYISSNQRVNNAAGQAEINNSGWFLQGSYVLTGEKNSYRGITPRKPFDPAKGEWGAWEIGARFSRIDLDDDAFRQGLVTRGNSASHAIAWTLGLNWYLNRAVRIQLNYERTNFDRTIATGAGLTDHEDVFLGRFQVAF